MKPILRYGWISIVNNEIEDHESFFRVIRPREAYPNLWKGERPSSAAFKDSRGLSVNRSDDDRQSSLDNLKHLQGVIAEVHSKSCKEVNITANYRPLENNVFHCELHRSKEQIELSPSQARHLAKTAKILNS